MTILLYYILKFTNNIKIIIYKNNSNNNKKNYTWNIFKIKIINEITQSNQFLFIKYNKIFYYIIF